MLSSKSSFSKPGRFTHAGIQLCGHTPMWAFINVQAYIAEQLSTYYYKGNLRPLGRLTLQGNIEKSSVCYAKPHMLWGRAPVRPISLYYFSLCQRKRCRFQKHASHGFITFNLTN